MNENEGEWDGWFAYVIEDAISGERLYTSMGFESQMAALQYGREDAQYRNAHGEKTVYDIILVY